MSPHGKELSEDLKKRIVALHKDGRGYKKIANTLTFSCSTVAKTIQRCNKTAYDHVFVYRCTSYGCDLVDGECKCDHKFEYKDEKSCRKVISMFFLLYLMLLQAKHFTSEVKTEKLPTSRKTKLQNKSVTMLLFFLVFLFSSFCQPAESVYNCTACHERQCPPMITPCPGREAIDPCGCCRHCAKQEEEICGGSDWEYGYCDNHYKCAAINGTGLVEIPNIGVCKDMPAYRRATAYFEDDDENCPEQSGCYKVMGMCDCITKRTCIPDFSMSKYNPLYCEPKYDTPDYDHLFEYRCTSYGCDLVDGECKCERGVCDRKFEYKDEKSCHKVLRERLCANVTCPEEEPLKCPRDSVATKPHTPYGQCCPTIPSECTCNFKLCNSKCPDGKRKVMAWESDGIPGRCCDKFLCLL
ncbi:cysteine-rich motor neuron 1 protein-like [Ranitomeya imitator]|uniref:cysteine-rich motor neuron 1 protein-like n=1 Tax=Ranitomeya imitator TaxID=111125 RepID=UPI0037E7E8FB